MTAKRETAQQDKRQDKPQDKKQAQKEKPQKEKPQKPFASSSPRPSPKVTKTFGPAPRRSANPVGLNKSPRTVVGSPFADRPPAPVPAGRFQGHDSLCRVVDDGKGNPVMRNDGIRNCWCMCHKCWDKDGQKCHCRYCPCTSAGRSLGHGIIGGLFGNRKVRLHAPTLTRHAKGVRPAPRAHRPLRADPGKLPNQQ